MFERFTQQARQVVVLAQDEARALKHDYIGTEHILLGLLREQNGIAARALASLGITTDEVRAAGDPHRRRGRRDSPGQLPFTPRAKRTLERALREALSLGHRYIGTEHILLGLLSVDEGVAVRVLGALDAAVRPEDVRAQVLQLVGEAGEAAAARAVRPAARELALSPATARALARAQDEALALQHDAVRPEHLMLGLLGEPGLAARVLGSLEISAEVVRAELSALVPPAGAIPAARDTAHDAGQAGARSRPARGARAPARRRAARARSARPHTGAGRHGGVQAGARRAPPHALRARRALTSTRRPRARLRAFGGNTSVTALGVRGDEAHDACPGVVGRGLVVGLLAVEEAVRRALVGDDLVLDPGGRERAVEGGVVLCA